MRLVHASVVGTLGLAVVLGASALMTSTSACTIDEYASEGEGEGSHGGEGEGAHAGEGEGEGGTGADIPGTITVVSSNNALPAAQQVSDLSVLKSDGSGANAASYFGTLTEIAVQTTPTSNPCPLPFTSSTGTTFCDGFNATANNQSVIVDYFSYLGTHPACTLPPTAALPTITGIWQSSFNATTNVETWTLALGDCSGIGAGTAYAGTATPTASHDIKTLMASFTGGQVVTVSGVVVAKFGPTSSGDFGFALEDPDGAPGSGILVTRGKTSASTATAPNVGDYVTVKGTTHPEGATAHQIKL